jgi:hypothetical protein
MSKYEIIYLAGFFVSIAISVLSFFRTVLFEKKQNKINGYLIDKHEEEKMENQKALISAGIYESEDPFSPTKIKISNIGKSTARKIRFECNSNSIKIFRNDLFPYPLLNPNESVDIPVIIESKGSVPLIKFIWNDNFGNDRIREQTLNIY